MKLIMLAGPPSVGKTTIIKRIIEMNKSLYKIAYYKIDVVSAYEDIELKKMYQIETNKIYSGEMCPDHAGVMILSDIYKNAEKNNVELIIIESAGLCLRCSPFLNQGLGVIVLNLTAGIKSAEKMKAIITYADIAVLTKIDLVSQAEREVFIHSLKNLHPNLKIIETNALQGTSLSRLNQLINNSLDIDFDSCLLKGNPPVGTCTICVGKKDLGWQNHFGVVRRLDSNITDFMYRGD